MTDCGQQPTSPGGRPTRVLTRRDVLRSISLVGALAATPLLSGCGSSAGRPKGPTRAKEGGIALADVPRSLGGAGARPRAVSAVQAFTADLYKRIAAEPGNVVCSPYSVAVALAMSRNGAKGKTATEMDAVLHVSGLQELDDGLNSLTRLIESRAGSVKRLDGTQGTISLDVANSLWGQQGTTWQHAFLVDLARYFGTGMRQVNYVKRRETARTLINTWTSDQTHGRIPEIIPPNVLDLATRLVLVNAIYLKAPWEETFPSRDTRRQPFTRLDGSKVDVDMMSGRLLLAAYGTGPGWRAARLPYVGGDLAMTLVAPDTNLRDLEATLDGPTLAAILKATKPVGVMKLQLPRWQYRLSARLNDDLQALGMPTAFGTEADFSGMTTQDQLYIGAVLHQAFISVDEHGTEAAAATAVIMEAASGGGPPPVVLNLDRPFLFLIHDVTTATPLFIGRVSDPSAT
jgi:serpin B